MNTKPDSRFHSAAEQATSEADPHPITPSLGITNDADWVELGRRVLSEAMRRASNDWRRRNSALINSASQTSHTGATLLIYGLYQSAAECWSMSTGRM